MKNKLKIGRFEVFAFIFFLFLTFGITSYSSSLVHLTECPDYDSYAYRYMGMLIAKGGIPYRDGFDNKGPVMYLINWIGYLINKEYGIYFVEFVFVLLFILVQYKFALKFTDKIKALIFTVASISSLSVFFVGNWTEEYSLLFLALGLYVFADYCIFGKDDWYRIVICGISFCCALFLRPNMVAPWVVFVIYIIIRYIYENKKFPVALTLWFCLGVFAVFVPIMIWLGVNGALEEFWKDLVLSNFTYATEHAVVTSRNGVFKNFFFSSCMEIHVILLIIMIFKKKNVSFNITYLIYMFFNLYLISMKGVQFDNYAMTIVPSLLYPLCSFDKYVLVNIEDSKRKLYILGCGLLSLMLALFIVRNLKQFAVSVKNGNPYGTEDEFVVSQIVKYTDHEDRILVLGYKPFYYVASDRLSSTMFYYSTNNYGYPDGHQAVVDSVNENLPKLIVVEGGNDPENLFEHYDKYEMIDNNPMLWIYKE